MAVARLLIFGDLLIVSAANMLVAIALARSYSPQEFASYGIGLSIALVLQAVQRNGFLINLSLFTESRVRVLRRVLLGEHLIFVGIVVGVATIVAILVELSKVDQYGKMIVIATIPSLLFLLSVDFDRFFFLKRRKGSATTAWALVYLAAMAALGAGALWEHLPFYGFLSGMALFSVAKLVWIVVVTGGADLARGWQFLKRDTVMYLRPALIGVAAYAGYTHVPLFVLGYTSAPIYPAAVVAMRNLLQPLQVVFRSLDVVDKHLFAEARLGGGTAAQHRFMRRTAVIYLATSVALALVVCLNADPLVMLIYGPKYLGFEWTLYGLAAMFVILGVSFPLESAVFARGDTERYFSTRLYGGVAAMLVAYPLCARYNDVGAVVAMLFGAIIAIVSLTWFARRELLPGR
jgi:O-antigen/teichoic acid export membrane protein